MKILNADIDLDQFFDGLSAAEERVLFFDFDGTLAPFQHDRHEVVPYDGVRERLNAMLQGGHTRIVIVTGRVVSEMPGLLGLDATPEIWGTHGWERRHPDGRVDDPVLDAGTERALSRAVEHARTLDLGDRLERKPTTVAIHTRGLSEGNARDLVDRVRTLWKPLTDGSAVRLDVFDGGMEMRVPGCDKGTAVATVLGEMNDPVAAYLGDDRTDEDGFGALGDNGLSVLVRKELRETAADVWIQPPDELLEWLDRWHRASKGET